MLDGPKDSPVTVARGPNYRQVLGRIHATLTPDWYLEVGTATGNSLAQSRGKAMAVDPKLRLSDTIADVLRNREQLHLFQMTSDAFFESGVAGRLAERIDFAFLDGMHLFEYLLRDFINTERLCAPSSTIALHDLVPVTNICAAREWDRENTSMWTGDVWKVVPILREFRPDLDVRIVDARPTGLGLVTNLDPKNDTLGRRYDEIVARYMDMSIQQFGAEALARELAMTAQNDPELSRFLGKAD